MEELFIGYLGYFATREEALTALAEYNANPYNIEENKITFSEVYDKWSKEHFEKVSNSAIENYSNAYRKYCKTLYNMRFKDIRLTHLQGIIDTCRYGTSNKSSYKNSFWSFI